MKIYPTLEIIYKNTQLKLYFIIKKLFKYT
jgi:hypothetical protein